MRAQPTDDETGVSWPAVIHRAGEPELTAVSDYAEWFHDADLSCWPYGEEDRLIDSAGQVFALDYDGDSPGRGLVSLRATGASIDSESVHQMVLAHLAAHGLSSLPYESARRGPSGQEAVRRMVEYVDRSAR